MTDPSDVEPRDPEPRDPEPRDPETGEPEPGDPEPGAGEPDPLHAGERLVLFGSGAVAQGRRARRAHVLAMRPVDPTETAAVRSRPPRGLHWEYVRADGISEFVRAADVGDAAGAVRDADRVFADPDRLRLLYVRGRETGQLSWWLADDREPVLVAPRLWLPTQHAAVVRHARRARAALRTQPPWGRYLA
ncbi:hypothetical protein [Microbacterium album]|uniref:Uncharacterized protein n=1 Tax=Microbacterium album TaxID=2053191 RepID=A0A917IIG2_9MICO|nr:hypothetical protein [Microbacterium album]GGH51152.1 hypothetical protein GCM10010921_30400 [Microbacterium album]